MTHPFIEASLKYRKSQAFVLREAEAFLESGKTENLTLAVKAMQQARTEYQDQKTKAFQEPPKQP